MKKILTYLLTYSRNVISLSLKTLQFISYTAHNAASCKYVFFMLKMAKINMTPGVIRLITWHVTKYNASPSNALKC